MKRKKSHKQTTNNQGNKETTWNTLLGWVGAGVGAGGVGGVGAGLPKTSHTGIVTLNL